MGPANANKHYILHFSQFPSDADPPDLETILGEMLLSGRSENASEVAQSCPTPYDPMDSSLHQAPPSMGFSRQEYWSGFISFSRESSRPRDRTQVSLIVDRHFTV